MTNNSMSCDAFTDRLMAYLEDETDAQTRVAIERHAVTCGDCGAILADLRKLRIDAANMPELAPSRDLWSGIAERIEAPVVSIGRPAARGAVVRGRAWKTGLLAASLVGATTLGYFVGNRRTEDVITQVAQSDTVFVPSVGAPTLDGTVPGGSVATTQTPTGVTRAPLTGTPVTAPAAVPASLNAQRVVAALTADYDKEIKQLNTLLESRRNQLDPVTVAVIERNLQVIDAAITESKVAIARDPASRFLIESLNQSLQMKVELMRTAAMLPSRT
jgi:anti-sigma factor RsiW